MRSAPTGTQGHFDAQVKRWICYSAEARRPRGDARPPGGHSGREGTPKHSNSEGLADEGEASLKRRSGNSSKDREAGSRASFSRPWRPQDRAAIPSRLRRGRFRYDAPEKQHVPARLAAALGRIAEFRRSTGPRVFDRRGVHEDNQRAASPYRSAGKPDVRSLPIAPAIETTDLGLPFAPHRETRAGHIPCERTRHGVLVVIAAFILKP